MDKIKCTIIQDILPLYVDNIVCDDTKELIDEHIENCNECKKILDNMKKTMEIPIYANGEAEDIRNIKKIKKSINKKMIKGMFLTAVVLITIYLLFLGTLSFLYKFGITADIESVECMVMDGTDGSILHSAEMVDSDRYEEGLTRYSYDGKLPSENPNDYMTIYCNLHVKNNSLFEQVRVDANVSYVENSVENLLFSYSSSNVVYRFVDSGEDAVITARMHLYIADMSDEDIEKFIDGVIVDFIVGGEVRKQIKLSDCENVIIER